MTGFDFIQQQILVAVSEMLFLSDKVIVSPEVICFNSVQAHFAKFTGRDAAMSKSLNSDYLSQLYIRADTKSMDREFVKAEVATSGLPEEARALIVWKRGYASTAGGHCLPACLHVRPSVRPSVPLSVRPSVCMSVCLFVLSSVSRRLGQGT